MTQRYYNPQREGCKRPTPQPAVNQPGCLFAALSKKNIILLTKPSKRERNEAIIEKKSV